MKIKINSMFFVFIFAAVLLNGCGSSKSPTSASNIEPPDPTPTGIVEYFDVTINQQEKDVINIFFRYKFDESVDLLDVRIMATALTSGRNCNIKDEGSISLSTYGTAYFIVNPHYSDTVIGPTAPTIGMIVPGKCSFKGFMLTASRGPSSSSVTLDKQVFKIPFEIEN